MACLALGLAASVQRYMPALASSCRVQRSGKRGKLSSSDIRQSELSYLGKCPQVEGVSSGLEGLRRSLSTPRLTPPYPALPHPASPRLPPPHPAGGRHHLLIGQGEEGQAC